MRNTRKMFLQGSRDIALHHLHVVNVILNEEIFGSDIGDDLNSLLSPVQEKARNIQRVDRLDQQANVFPRKRICGEAQIAQKHFIQLEQVRIGRRRVSKGIVPEIDLSEPVSLKNITKKATQDLERQIILKVLQENSWNRQKTAKWLQISYRSLLYKLSEVGMPDVPPRPLRIPHLVKEGDERTLKPALSSRTRIY